MALAITREAGTSFVARHPDGTEVVVKVFWVRGDQVRLSIDAPRTVVIERDDIRKGVRP